MNPFYMKFEGEKMKRTKQEEFEFDADAINKAMDDHLEKTGNAEASQDTKPTVKIQGDLVIGESGMMPPRENNSPLAHLFDGDPNDLTGEDLGDGRYGMKDDDVATKLLDKNFSPMIIRKYTRIGFPLYVHLICDENLDDLDEIVHNCIDYCRENGVLSNNIQSLRNFTGVLSDWINQHYDTKKRGCVESLGIIFYADKMIISSLQGDAMNHASCRDEMYHCLNLMAKI